MRNKHVMVVIPFHKNEIQLAKCKKALQEQTFKNLYYKVYDDSETEKGFTATCNTGLIESTRSDLHFKDSQEDELEYVVLLNQDCYLKPDAIEVMAKFMDEHPNCSIAGIKQLMASDPDKIIHGGTRQCFPQGIHEMGLKSKGDCNVTKQVPWVNGAVMIFRVSDLIITGILDENMKMFASDADISYRTRAAGKECWYIAEAECLHEWGASKSMEGQMALTFQTDMLYFRDKWLNGELYKDLAMEYFK